MAGRRKISSRSLCAGGYTDRNKCRYALALALALALFGLGSAPSVAQQVPNAIVAAGNAAVTGFSGALPPIEIAPGVDPGDETFIDLKGPSLRVVDLQHMGGPAAAQRVAVPKPFTFTSAQIGQVFGVALDDDTPPNIYAAATSAYGLPIAAQGPDGKLRHLKLGERRAIFMPGLWGPNGGPGSIWKIDGVTGRVSLFTNVTVNGRANSGAALGGLAYDPVSKSLYVSDRESGFIYRVSLGGRIRDRYDHGVTGRAAQGLPPVPWNSRQPIDITSPRFDSTRPATWNYAAPARRIFGLAVFRRRLYYAVADSLQIWSVGLNADGSFASDAVIELAVPPSSGPTEISQIAFDEQGRMYLAERPAPTGAFDFEALAVPAIGRVLRYAVVGRTPDGRRIWQPDPDEYAIGFARQLRNDNGGVAVGYNYDHNGNIIWSSCGGFLWSTGEDLRDASDPELAARLGQSGPLHVTGLQGNGTWRIERNGEPPLESYFVDYADAAPDDAARGHMGGIVIARPCLPRARPRSPLPPAGGPPIRHGGLPPGRGAPPGTPPRTPPQIPVPPGGCPPDQVRNVTTGSCGSCPRPNIQINGKCCSVATLAANGACSNSSCPSGQTPVGPSNFCCNANQVYTDASGAQACCSGPLVNGQCQPPTPPASGCPVGYVSVGGSCCLASQLTSTGTCCPPGQVPSGPNKSRCEPYIPIHYPPLCCPSGQIPVSGPKPCCPTANVTTNGMCCPGPVDPNNRAACVTLIPIVPACAPGYVKMPNGSCCNRRFVSADGKSCNTTRLLRCPRGAVLRDGRCVALPPVCPPGQVRRDGRCIRLPPPACPRGEVRNPLNGRCVRRPPRGCPPGEIRSPRGICVRIGVPPRIFVPPRPGGVFLPPPRGGVFAPRPGSGLIR
jgi:hypothetical protein